MDGFILGRGLKVGKGHIFFQKAGIEGGDQVSDLALTINKYNEEIAAPILEAHPLADAGNLHKESL